MAQNGTKRRVLDLDLLQIRGDPRYAEMDVQVHEKPNGQEFWRLKVRGDNYYKNYVYEMEIHFSRHHPYEAPSVLFPTCSNQRNLKHPKVDADGRLRSDTVNLDAWTPVTTVMQILDEVRGLFSENPPLDAYYYSSSVLDTLSTELLHRVSFYLGLKDIASLAEVSKKHLAIMHLNQFWVTLYYQRCNLSNNILFQMDRPGPLRVMSSTGQWHWREARESFIQAYECSRYAKSVPPMEALPLQELRVLSMVAHPGFAWTAGSAASAPREELQVLWRYRLRRSARLCRWLCGDARIKRSLADQSR